MTEKVVAIPPFHVPPKMQSTTFLTSLPPPSPQRTSDRDLAVDVVDDVADDVVVFDQLKSEARGEIRLYLASLPGMIFDFRVDAQVKDILKDVTAKDFDAVYIRQKLTDFIIEMKDVEDWKERYVLARGFYRLCADRDVCGHVCNKDIELSDFIFTKVYSLTSSDPKDACLVENNVDLFDRLLAWYSPIDRLKSVTTHRHEK